MASVVVKLGSSVVAHDNGELRLSVVSRVCEEIATLHRSGVDVVLVTSGAIAYGMRLLGLDGRPSAVAELQAASAVGQGRLYRTYDEFLRERDIQSAQILLTFFDMSARTHYLNARRTLQTLLGWRIVPVINENDTTTTDEISFGDNDFLAAQVAVLVDASLLVLCTDIAGLYTADPRSDPTAELVAEVSDPRALSQLRIGRATSSLGSGGMASKVNAAEMATAAGIPTVIGSGLEPGLLGRAWAGEPGGTRFTAQATRQPSFKLWLKYAKPSRGVVAVDPGAARALREGGTSLLPVGIVDVQGGFEAGDAVEVVERTAGGGPAPSALVGKGICNYSAQELRRVKGLKSAEVLAVLPRATEEAVHRDYFVLA
jgi:glutamate 5-kinase